MTLDPVRLQTLVLARAQTAGKDAPTAATLAKDLERFAPAPGPGWRALVEAALGELIRQRVIDEQRRVVDGDALGQRLGVTAALKWPQLTDLVLPAIALGMSAKDVLGKKGAPDGRDGWAAAIAARALGFWQGGPPPKPAAVCDRLVWERLGLKGKVGRLPDAVRAVFLQRELATTPAPTDRLLRLLAAREVGSSSELKALRHGLVRRWLEHGALGAGGAAMPADAATAAPATAAGDLAAGDFAADVRAALAGIAESDPGSHGAHKVFIFAAWEALRRHPAWRELGLDDFKARLVAAQRAGEVVLARADLVGAMSPALVERSEIDAGGATFHFVVRSDPRGVRQEA